MGNLFDSISFRNKFNWKFALDICIGQNTNIGTFVIFHIVYFKIAFDAFDSYLSLNTVEVILRIYL